MKNQTVETWHTKGCLAAGKADDCVPCLQTSLKMKEKLAGNIASELGRQRAINDALVAALKRFMAFDGRYAGRVDGKGGERMDDVDMEFNLTNLRDQAQIAISRSEGK